jgi:CRP-like cAMP-binding protein
MSETIWFLKCCDLFANLTPLQRQRLESHATLRAFKPGEIIYFPTEPGQSVLLLALGRVKIKSLAPDGRETIFAFIDEGELFGELAIVDTKPRDEFAEAVGAARVLAIPRDDLLWLMGQRPEVALHITKLLGFRIRRIENRLRNILFRSTRERLVSLLLELLDSHGERVGPHWEIRLRLSHQELASLIGATRETVTLALGRLQRERLIVVERRRIRVLDRGRLAAEQESGSYSPVATELRPQMQRKA